MSAELGRVRVPMPTDGPAYRHTILNEIGQAVSAPGAAPAGQRTSFVLPVERVAPMVRIAHQLDTSVAMVERHLFDHELIVVLEGEGHARIGDQAQAYRPGTVLLIPPFVSHRVVSFNDRQPCHLAVHFDWAAGLPDTDRALDQRQPYRVVIDGAPTLEAFPGQADRQLVRRLQAVVRAHHSPQRHRRQAANIQLAGVLLDLADRAVAMATATAPAPALLAVEQAIARDPGHPWDVAALARVADLSPSRFTAVFRDQMGQTPMRYLKAVRIERARQLLADPQLTVAAIAAACGYPDPYHFSRVFRVELGRSPRAWRAALQRGEVLAAL